VDHHLEGRPENLLKCFQMRDEGPCLVLADQDSGDLQASTQVLEDLVDQMGHLATVVDLGQETVPADQIVLQRVRTLLLCQTSGKNLLWTQAYVLGQVGRA
jgi:hypothetical protein